MVYIIMFSWSKKPIVHAPKQNANATGTASSAGVIITLNLPGANEQSTNTHIYVISF